MPSDPRIVVDSLDTPDGERLTFWHAPPEDPACPTLLWLHGNAASLHREPWRLARVLDAGLGLAAVAYRGYGGSTGRPSEAGVKADGRAAYAWLTEQGVAAGDIVLHGTSLGSGVAVWLAAEGEVGAVILEAPFLSLEALAREKLPLLPVGRLLRHPFRSDLAMPRVTEPVLAVHGTMDVLIPPAHAEALVALAGGPARLVLLAGSDHNTLIRDGLYERAGWPFLAEIYPDCAGLRQAPAL